MAMGWSPEPAEPEWRPDEATKKMVGAMSESILVTMAAYVAAKSRAMWFWHVADRVRRNQAGQPAEHLMTQAAESCRLILQYEKEADPGALGQSGRVVDEAVRTAVSGGLISAEDARDLAARPASLQMLALFMDLLTLLPPGDALLTMDGDLLDRLGHDLALDREAVAAALQDLERHHLVVSLTPAHPIGSPEAGLCIVAVNPMLTDSKDPEKWESARNSWDEYLRSL